MKDSLRKYQVECVGGVFIASAIITDFFTPFTLAAVGKLEREAVTSLKNQYWLFNKIYTESIK